MKFRFVACCLALIMSPAFAAPPLAKIQTMLAKPAMLCGRFDQSKQLVGMKKPLLSNGRFCVSAGKGVLWRTLQPFPNTLRLTRDEIVQTQGERVALRLDAKQEPVVRMINNVMFSLLAGDFGQLDTLFEGMGNADADKWNVSLKARDPGLAKVIAGVSLEGGTYVKSIVIDEANGDRTSIVFSAMQSGDAALASAEAALF